MEGGDDQREREGGVKTEEGNDSQNHREHVGTKEVLGSPLLLLLYVHRKNLLCIYHLLSEQHHKEIE